MPVLELPPSAPAPHTGPVVHELRLVTTGGVVQQELANFQLTQVQWQLNSMGLIQWTIPTQEPTFAPYALDTAKWEIQYFRYGQLYWWGVMVDVEILGDGSTTQVTGYGLFWYAHKRFFGMANRVNWVKGYTYNNGFQQPATHFTPVSTHTDYSVTPPSPLIGSGPNTVVQLSGAGGTDQAAGEDAYLEQSVSFPNGGWTPQAPGLIMTAWYYLENFTGPAANFPGGLGATMRGLWMGLYKIDGVTPLYNVGAAHDDGSYTPNLSSGQATSAAQITKAATTGSWVRLQAALIPPVTGSGAPFPFVCKFRLYAPGGKILWGGLAMNQLDGYYPPAVGNVRENVIVQRIAQICLQPSSLHDDNLEQMDTSKTDLNIGFDCPTMNVSQSTSYPYANHQNIMEALQDWQSQYQGLDMEILFPDPQHRNFTTWGTANKGRKGLFQPWLPLFIEPFLESGQFSANAENGGSNVLEIGVDMSTTVDSGAANIEGGYINKTEFGGKDIEIVETAPNDINVGALQPLARQRQQTIGGTPKAPVIRQAANWIGFGPIIVGSYGLHVGDTVPVFGTYGWMVFTGQVYRIVQIDYYPGEDGGVVDYTLNLPDPYAQVPSPV